MTHFHSTKLKMWDEEELERRLEGYQKNIATKDVAFILGWNREIIGIWAKKLGITAKLNEISVRGSLISKVNYYTHDDVRELNRRYKASKQNADIVTSNS